MEDRHENGEAQHNPGPRNAQNVQGTQGIAYGDNGAHGTNSTVHDTTHDTHDGGHGHHFIPTTVFEAIKTRRSVRNYQGKPIP